MTSRWLKDNEGNFIQGKNGKKLRYLFCKKTGNVKTTFDKNWTDEAINLLSETYNNIERVEVKRGRPKKHVLDTEKPTKKVKRKNEKKIEKTAATNDTSDEDDELFDIEGYSIIQISGRRYYKNNKGWLFDVNGLPIN